MSDLNVTFAGLPLESPIIIEIEDDRIDRAVVEQCQETGVGGILFPELNEERLARVHDRAELTEHNRDDQGNRDSDRILRRLNTEEHLEHLETTVKTTSLPVIASLQSSKRGHWFTLAQQMIEAGAAAVEIRPYNRERFQTHRSDQIEKSILRTTAYIADRLEAPIIVRIPTFLHGTRAFTQALGDAGASAVLIDPPTALLGIDIESARLTVSKEDRTAAYSAFLTALTSCRTLYRRVSPHIALQLPENASSTVVMALLGGATVATLPVPGNDADAAAQSVRRYLAYLRKWMTAHSMESLFDFRGSLSESRVLSTLEN